MKPLIEFLEESKLNHPTFTGSDSVEENVNAIIDEIARTRAVMDSKSKQFFNFRRFLLTIGFNQNWSLHRLKNSYFRTYQEDFYFMIIGKIPATLRQIKIRAKGFLEAVDNYNKWD